MIEEKTQPLADMEKHTNKSIEYTNLLLNNLKFDLF